jgi:hypothetical protein
VVLRLHSRPHAVKECLYYERHDSVHQYVRCIIQIAAASTILLAATLSIGACGGSTGQGPHNVGAATKITTSPTPDTLSPAALEALVVTPPPPFRLLPDDELKTGLMEAGNPKSGEIAIGFAQEPQLTAAGFQRGWEKAFRAPDRAVVDDYVFEFRTTDGPSTLVRLFQSTPQTGYETATVPGVPGSIEYVGTSPEGRTAVVTAAAHGRFLFGVTVGGPPGAHPYRALLESLAKEQLVALP